MQPARPAEPQAAEPEVEPSEPLAGHLDAQRMQGPARSLCGAVNRMLGNPVDCTRVGLRERDDNLLRARHDLDPEGPWLAVHFVEYLYDEEGMDSACGLLVRTEAGWWAHGLDGMLCANSGSTRIHVGAELRFEAIGPDGAKRLIVGISNGFSHSTEGEETHDELLICGETEGRVACHWMRVGASFVEGDPDLVLFDDAPRPTDWNAEITFLSGDRIRVGEHSAPDGLRPPPAPGVYEIRYDMRPR